MTPAEAIVAIKRSDRAYYVYVLSRPTGIPFYVGIGTGRRILDHAIFARRPSLDSHKLRVIRKIWRAGEEIDYSIREWFDVRSDAERYEVELICDIGRRNLRTGPLSNVTAGGEGARSPADDVLSRRSIALRAAWAKRDKTTAMAHLRAPHVIALGAASRTGRKRPPYKPRAPGWMTDDMRVKRSAALKADPISRRPGVGAKISAAKLGVTINSWMKSSEARRRFSRGNHPGAKIVVIDGRQFSCIADAADAYAVNRNTITAWLAYPGRPRRKHAT